MSVAEREGLRFLASFRRRQSAETELPQKCDTGAGILGPNVIWAHCLEDRLVGIVQKRRGFGILTLARQGFAEAAGKDRVLNFVLAMFAIEPQRASIFGLGQFKFSGGRVNLSTQLIQARQIRLGGRPSYCRDLRPGRLKRTFRFRVIPAKPVGERQPFTNIDRKDGIVSVLEWPDEV